MPDPWAFQLHPEVLVLVAFLSGAYVYLVRSIGPVAVAAGERPITRRNIWCFVSAMALLFTSSWWPLHDIAESYLYSAHMLQHMMLSYFMPPLVLLATPEWLMRSLIGSGRFYRVVRWLCIPVVAGVAFNGAVIVTHIPGVVTASVESAIVHYSLHVLVVVTSLLMWMVVCGPIPEFRIGPAPTMIYLFLQSVIPTIPAGWLTFAEGAVYPSYGAQPVRVWGLSVATDQQLAGGIMKTGGSIFLWAIIVRLWFKHFVGTWRADQRARPHVSPGDETLTYEDVEREFAATPAPREPAGQ